MSNKFFDIKLLKFLLTGIVNTIIGAGLMFLLFNVFHCSYWISSASNYIIGGIVSFLLNKFFTFQNKEKSALQVLLFVINLLICYFIAYILAKILIFHIFSALSEISKGNIAMACGMILYTGLNYIGQRFIVFSEKKASKETL